MRAYRLEYIMQLWTSLQRCHPIVMYCIDNNNNNANTNTNTNTNTKTTMDTHVWMYILPMPLLMLAEFHLLLLFSQWTTLNYVWMGVNVMGFIVYAIRVYSALHHYPTVVELNPQIDVERVFEARRVSERIAELKHLIGGEGKENGGDGKTTGGKIDGKTSGKTTKTKTISNSKLMDQLSYLSVLNRYCYSCQMISPGQAVHCSKCKQCILHRCMHSSLLSRCISGGHTIIGDIGGNAAATIGYYMAGIILLSAITIGLILAILLSREISIRLFNTLLMYGSTISAFSLLYLFIAEFQQLRSHIGPTSFSIQNLMRLWLDIKDVGDYDVWIAQSETI